MNKNLKRLVVCGVMLAIAFALSFFKIGLPFGGSVTLFSMVPICVVACLYGPSWGLLTSTCAAVLQLLQGIISSKSFILDEMWQTILMIFLDYILAFVVLGLAGMFESKENRQNPGKNFALLGVPGALIVTIARYICHTISGYILYGAWAEWFFTDEFVNDLGNAVLENFDGNGLAWIYSIIYNGLYMIPEIILTCIGTYIILKLFTTQKNLKKLWL